MNSLLWEKLYDTQIRKIKRILLLSIKKILQEKKTRWITWNAEKSKIMHQVNKLSEKSDNKSKFLKTKQEKMKERIKATSF